MTDKQIIFNCDVDCIHKNTEECFELECIYGQESILKQLSRKEQECEGLRYEIGSLENDRDILQEQLDQLKAENEQLKNFHINLVGVKECEIRELDQLKSDNKHLNDLLNQALKELEEHREAIEKIKEIANRTCSTVKVEVCDSYDSCADCGATSQYRKLMQILQKISEVENGI